MRAFLLICVTTVAAIFVYFVGENLTPEIVMVGLAIILGSGFGIVVLLTFAWALKLFVGGATPQKPVEYQQPPSAPPVIVIQPPAALTAKQTKLLQRMEMHYGENTSSEHDLV